MTPTRTLDWGAILPAATASLLSGLPGFNRCLRGERGRYRMRMSVAKDNWRQFMSRNPAAEPGCFHAAYPNYLWEKAACQTLAQPHVHPVLQAPGERSRRRKSRVTAMTMWPRRQA